MKRKIKIINIHRFILAVIIFILIIVLGVKIFNSTLKNKDSNNYEISSKKSANEIVETPKIENTNDITKSQDTKKEKNKKHESKAIPLAEGKKSNNTLPVLMYHYFYDDSKGEEAPDSNYMPTSSFEAQLKYLSENDFYYPTWEEVADFVDGKIDLPDKSVLLTMDDGDESVFDLALPLLEKYKVPATSFIITSEFDEKKLEKYADSIIDFESHTDNMHRGGGTIGHGGIFPELSLEEGTEDLKTSIKKLGGNSGALAYPFGDCTEKTKKAAKNAGFKVAFTTVNKSVKPGMDKYELPRLRMFSDIKLAGFKYYVE